jgi:hypothetical protein
MEQWWNNSGMGKLEYWERNLFQCHFAHHKSHMDRPTTEPEPLWEKDGI